MRRIRAIVPLGEDGIPDPFASVAAAAALAAAHGLPATALLLGRRVDDGANARAAHEGASAILAVEHEGLADPPSAAQWLAALAAVAGADDTLDILPAGALGDELAARLATRLGAVPLGRCRDVTLDGARLVARRATHGGRAEAVLETTASHAIAVMRRPAVAPLPVAAPGIARRALGIALPGAAAVACRAPVSGAVRLEGAAVVVSGGRGMDGPEGFDQLAALAHAVGGATAASLPAVDAGWAGVSQQVGQSGAFVAPAVYLACGISGTAQHLAGIGQATRILAVNVDAEADIFRVAALGLVARWQDVLPSLIEEIRRPERVHGENDR